MVSYRQLRSRPGRGWCRPRPPAGSSRRRFRRIAAHVLLPVLMSLCALLGAVPAQADAGFVRAEASSGSRPTAAPTPVAPPVIAPVIAPVTAPVTVPISEPVVEIASPGWLSRLARPVMVIGLVIVIASIVSILRDI